MPDSVAESDPTDNNYYTLDASHDTKDLDPIEGVTRIIESLDKEFEFLIKTPKSGSSEDKLDKSPSGSWDKLQEVSNRNGARSQSNSREKLSSSSSPVQNRERMSNTSSPVQTHSTFIPALALEDQAAVKKDFEPAEKSPRSKLLREVTLPIQPSQSMLKKTFPNARKSRELEDAPLDAYMDNVGNLDVRNVKQAISKYGTIPKGARIGAYLASLEANRPDPILSEDIDSPSSRPCSSPFSDMRSSWDKSLTDSMTSSFTTDSRPPWEKDRDSLLVELRPLGEGRSMSRPESMHSDAKLDLDKPRPLTPHIELRPWEKGEYKKSNGSPEHNVKPSTIFRSASTHHVASVAEKPPLAAAFQKQRQLSDLTGKKSFQDDSDDKTVSDKAQLTELDRKLKPLPAPRSTVKNGSDSPTPPGEAPPAGLADKLSLPRTPPPLPAPVDSPQSGKSSPKDSLVQTEEKVIPAVPTAIVAPSKPEPKVSVKKSHFSPPVPKKPVIRQRTVEKSESTTPSSISGPSGGESSMESSTDSVLQEGIPKPKPRVVPAEHSEPRATPAAKPEKPIRLRSPPPTAANEELKAKLASRLKKSEVNQNSSGKEEKAEKAKKNRKLSEPEYKLDAVKKVAGGSMSGGGKNMPPGGRPMLPGFPGGFPTKPHATPRNVIKQASESKEEVNESDEQISKEVVIEHCKELTSQLQNITVGNKNSASFMNLAEKVQSFHRMCTSYVENMPPYGKFHFRELLTTLQNLAENLKMCSGSSNIRETDHLFQDLLNSLKDIKGVLQK